MTAKQNSASPHGGHCCALVTILVLVTAAGCTIILRPEHNTFGEGSDADEDSSSDASDGDADADSDGDATERDADQHDADAADGDVFPVDADVDAPNCPPAGEVDTLALFDFDDHTLASTSGVHQWESETGRGCRFFEAGPDGCGDALAFDDCTGSWLTLPDRPEWDDIASIDFWIIGYPSASEPGRMGILSRDARGQRVLGHFSVFLAADGRLAARLQTTTTTVVLCSNSSISAEVWHHVELRFGLPQFELWLDGRQQLGTGEIAGVECNTDPSADIAYDLAGNDEPWVLGGLNWASDPDSAELVTNHLANAAIDHLRFRLTR